MLSDLAAIPGMAPGLPDAPILYRDTTVSLAPARARFSLRLKDGALTEARELTKLDLPEKVGATGKTQAKTDAVCACLGPDEWFISAPMEAWGALTTTLAKLEGKVVHSTTDISHRNIAMVVSGPQAAELLAVGCPLPLSPRAFPVARMTRTVFENAQVLLHRTAEDSFHVEAWRSFAPYLHAFFARVASQKAP